MAQAQDQAAAPLRIYAAGSLRGAMQALIKASGLEPAAFAEPVYGPAGLLGDRLAKGEAADLFASADMKQPLRFAPAGSHVLVVPFAQNRMCVVSKTSLGLTAPTLLDRLLAPDLRLATSTPVADPGGDYAMAVFDRADSIRPGSGALLRAKARHLLGSPTTMAASPGRNPAASIFLDDQADALIYYCSGAPALLRDVKDLVSLPMPDALEVHPTYGLAILSDHPAVSRFGLFILSTKGQAILADAGFLPLVAASK